jgi:hypothetical protein
MQTLDATQAEAVQLEDNCADLVRTCKRKKGSLHKNRGTQFGLFDQCHVSSCIYMCAYSAYCIQGSISNLTPRLCSLLFIDLYLFFAFVKPSTFTVPQPSPSLFSANGFNASEKIWIRFSVLITN